MILIGGGGLLVVAALTLLLGRIAAQHRTNDRIRISSAGGIDSIENVRLGGLEQWIQIRGRDKSKPILLFLHGGPGFPNMPFAHLNAELERHFVVVQWDQRGAGKSYSRSIPDESMRVAQFVGDAHELVQLLLARFGARRCYLVAHSWGSLLGAQLVAQYPELFVAYVGIGQAVDLPQTEQVLYQFALDFARRDDNQNAIADLERIGPPPHSDANHKFMEKWVTYYSEREHPSLSPDSHDSDRVGIARLFVLRSGQDSIRREIFIPTAVEGDFLRDEPFQTGPAHRGTCLFFPGASR